MSNAPSIEASYIHITTSENLPNDLNIQSIILAYQTSLFTQMDFFRENSDLRTQLNMKFSHAQELKFLLIALQLIFLSCNTQFYRTYVVSESLEIKKQHKKRDRTPMHQFDVRSITKRYSLPEKFCADSIKLQEIATIIFNKNHKVIYHQIFDTCHLLAINDSISQFQSRLRIIHGHDQMFFDKKNCVIIMHKGYTGKF